MQSGMNRKSNSRSKMDSITKNINLDTDRRKESSIPGPKLGVNGEGSTRWLDSVRAVATLNVGKSGKQLGSERELQCAFPVRD